MSPFIILIVLLATVGSYLSYVAYKEKDEEDKTIFSASIVIAVISIALAGFYAYREYRIAMVPEDPVLKSMFQKLSEPVAPLK
jgi:cell division protein FtsW (lipid II flippase)